MKIAPPRSLWAEIPLPPPWDVLSGRPLSEITILLTVQGEIDPADDWARKGGKI